MRTYNLQFSLEDNIGNIYHYKADYDGFRQMRNFALAVKMRVKSPYIGKFVDLFDQIREMEQGSEIFVISSEWEVFTADTLEFFNKKITRWEQISRNGELGDSSYRYMPNPYSAFVVKRTKIKWIFTDLM